MERDRIWEMKIDNKNQDQRNEELEIRSLNPRNNSRSWGTRIEIRPKKRRFTSKNIRDDIKFWNRMPVVTY